MSKSSHFIGQPIYSQLLNLLAKSQVLHHSRAYTRERYIKRFYAWAHLVVMFYAVVRCFLTPCEKSSLINNTIIIKSSI